MGKGYVESTWEREAGTPYTALRNTAESWAGIRKITLQKHTATRWTEFTKYEEK